jgi:hypothetical protein
LKKNKGKVDPSFAEDFPIGKRVKWPSGISVRLHADIVSEFDGQQKGVVMGHLNGSALIRFVHKLKDGPFFVIPGQACEVCNEE